jgi:hypothetical protein
MQFDVKNHVGSTVFVLVHKYKQGVETKFGTRNAINCTVVVIDGPWKGEIYPDCNLFNSKLVNQLRGMVGSFTLGRFAIGQGKAANPPFILADPTPEDEKTASAWLASHPGEIDKLQAEGKIAAEYVPPPQAPQQQQFGQPPAAQSWTQQWAAPPQQQAWQSTGPTQQPWQQPQPGQAPPPPPVSQPDVPPF